MIVTLTGPNEFARNDALQEIVAAFQAEQPNMADIAIERLDGETADFAQIQAALHNLSLFTPRRLVVAREPGKQKAFTEQLETILQQIPDTTDVILVEPKLDKRLSYYKQLKKLTDFRTFEVLDNKNLTSWVQNYIQHQNGKIATSDAQYLIDRVGDNQLQLKQEVDKLLLSGPNINRQTIDDLTDRTPKGTVFELLDAAFAGNIARVQQLYDQQRALQVEPQAILAMIFWQAQLLAVIKTAGTQPVDEIAKQAKLNPFVVRKTQTLARRLTIAHIKQLITRLLVLDVTLKTSTVNPDEAIRLLLLSL